MTDRIYETPDYDQVERYDVFLPFLAPTTDPLLRGLGDLPIGATVLDLACGVGEPALTLARRRPDLTVLGIDVASTQLDVARRAAQRAGVTNVRFDQMSMNSLELPDAAVSGVTSRMGALMAGDPERTVAEIARVLASDGEVSLVTYRTVAEQPALNLIHEAIATVLGAERAPDLSRMDAMSAEGIRDGWLRGARLRSVNSETLDWTVVCSDFDAYWPAAQAAISMFGLTSLDDAKLADLRHEVQRLAEPMRQADGSYEFPTRGQLLTARR